MQVVRVTSPVSSRESWTVLGDDAPVAPVDRYLAYLRVRAFPLVEAICLLAKMASDLQTRPNAGGGERRPPQTGPRGLESFGRA